MPIAVSLYSIIVDRVDSKFNTSVSSVFKLKQIHYEKDWQQYLLTLKFFKRGFHFSHSIVCFQLVLDYKLTFLLSITHENA